jgi:MFS-type transporter involved in bile tolerance (Atg22 family)
MRANAAVRVAYGFVISFLAFILRTEKFGHTSDKVALGGLALAIAAGGLIGTGIGSALRSRAPQLLMFVVLAITMVVTVVGAIMFGLIAVLIVALVIAIAQTLEKASLDSILQRDIPAEKRSSAFAFSETVHQLALVIGGLIGLALSLTNSGLTGLTVAAIGLAAALCSLLLARRHRILRTPTARFDQLRR